MDSWRPNSVCCCHRSFIGSPAAENASIPDVVRDAFSKLLQAIAKSDLSTYDLCLMIHLMSYVCYLMSSILHLLMCLCFVMLMYLCFMISFSNSMCREIVPQYAVTTRHRVIFSHPHSCSSSYPYSFLHLRTPTPKTFNS